jgi:hypothetical protein
MRASASLSWSPASVSGARGTLGAGVLTVRDRAVDGAAMDGGSGEAGETARPAPQASVRHAAPPQPVAWRAVQR